MPGDNAAAYRSRDSTREDKPAYAPPARRALNAAQLA